jgi:hypothetical protein
MPFELPDLPPLPDFPELANLDLPAAVTPALDEFTRTLEALDHISLDLPQPVSDLELAKIDQVTAVEDPALRELESWLQAIQLDRASR